MIPYPDPALVSAAAQLSRRIAARYDAHIAGIILAGLEPYSGTVYVVDDRQDLIRVRVGGHDGPVLTIPVDRYAFPHPPTPEELAADVARRTRAAWRALDPLEAPPNVVLGSD